MSFNPMSGRQFTERELDLLRRYFTKSKPTSLQQQLDREADNARIVELAKANVRRIIDERK